MVPKIPQSLDFPSDFKIYIIEPSKAKSISDVMILLHGLGDSGKNFATFGQRLNLPETLCVAIDGPLPLPFDLGGYHWGDDIIFDQISGEMDMYAGFDKVTKSLQEDVIDRVLVSQCGFQRRQIHLFGFGQGGMAAMNVAHTSSYELGGVVSIGGPLPQLSKTTPPHKSKTAALILHGSSGSAITVTAANRIKDAFEHASFHRWQRSGDSMPSNREEVLPIMQFLSRQLRSQVGVPAGAQEIT